MVDFSARITPGEGRGIPLLEIQLMVPGPPDPNIHIDPDSACRLKTAVESGRLRLGRITTRAFDFNNTYINKRQILYK